MLDVRPLFRPLSHELLAVLTNASAPQWEAPAVGAWTVRDVACHLLDTGIRRLAFHRDGLAMSPPGRVIDGFGSLVDHLDDLNRSWIVATRRISPAVLLDLLRTIEPQLNRFLESVAVAGPAFWPVAWAGEAASPAWLDLGREYTERWHHQQQIREALGAPLLTATEWLAPVLRVALHAVPRAYADTHPGGPVSVALRIHGAAGGEWTVAYDGTAWCIDEQAAHGCRASIDIDQDTAWRLLHKAMRPEDAARSIRAEGDPTLTRPWLRSLAIMG